MLIGDEPNGPAGVRQLALVGMVAALLAGCSLLVDFNGPQCDIDADCTARGAEFRGATCVRNLCVASAPAAGEANLECAAPASNGQATVKYSFAVQVPTTTTGDAATPLRVQACQQLDVDCQAPVAGPFDVLAGTLYDFQLPQGFSGFFQITSAATLPALYFLARPVVADTIGWSPTVLSKDVVAELAAAAGVSLDPASGVVLASIRDCNGAPLAGANVTASDEQAIRYYVVNNLPVLSAMETSAQGVVGFANVPASTIAIDGVSKAGRAFPPASVRVKPGSLSLVEIRP